VYIYFSDLCYQSAGGKHWISIGVAFKSGQLNQTIPNMPQKYAASNVGEDQQWLVQTGTTCSYYIAKCNDGSV